MTEAGANPIEAMEGGEYAETLAAAMAGLADMFDLLMENTESAAGHEDVIAGFRKYKEEYAQDLIDVQEHGLGLANNIQAGAGRVAENDLESAEELRSPWESHRDINFD
ncbi:hypothetical protein [Nocardiopsis sp. NRRL B-16309]|uniref:hypothetical protein n=1 Tax=Nocardiopsis sp. NRRL B-16309 TaxID=1519494 RepID=UPI0006AD864E|nr:hypothetical protein [Nocardiopsis sp. NRRL B-16309]KOX11231.1 hypothetical protein ADL05_23590 [Nocardiopsis sp. NRRL B-16309]